MDRLFYRRTVFFFLFFLHSAAAFFPQNKIQVRVKEIKNKAVYDTLIYGARLEPAALLKVYSPISGFVDQLYVKEGNLVKVNQKLMVVRRKTASSDFLPSVIRSPIDGIVAYVNVVSQNEIFERGELITIGDISSYKVNLLLSDKDIHRIKRGDSVYLKESSIYGKVDSINLVPEGDTGLFRVSVLFDAQRGFFIGRFLELEIRVDFFRGVVIPMEQLVSKYGKTFVYLYTNGTAKMQEITLGKRYNKEYSVLSGVRAGEKIIVSYDKLLFDGAEVVVTEDRPLEEKR